VLDPGKIKNLNLIEILEVLSQKNILLFRTCRGSLKEVIYLPDKVKFTTQYWPGINIKILSTGSFSNKPTNLKLLNGAYLSDEYLIWFNM
jgi:hypothetical protein